MTPHRARRLLFLALTVTLLSRISRAQWTAPTPEELSMTSQSEVPGAPAVYLYREEVTDDDNHNFNIYARIKVLTERGKEYGTIELPYEAGGHGNVEVTEIVGRTIHPDGSIVPFSGKPFEKLIEKTRDP